MENLKSNTLKKNLLLGTFAIAAAASVGGMSQVAHADTTDDGTNANYVVKQGDSLWSIANQNNMDLSELEQLNGKSDTDTVIHVGETLKLAGNATGTTPTSGIKYDANADTNKDGWMSMDEYNNWVSNGKPSTPAPVQAQAAPAPAQQTSTQNQAAAPVQQTAAQPQQAAQPRQVSTATPAQSSSSKDWIASRESGGSYTAQNPSGAYGKYQLMPFNLKYGTSPEGQERAADEYVQSRYGGWDQAKAFWQSHNWY